MFGNSMNGLNTKQVNPLRLFKKRKGNINETGFNSNGQILSVPLSDSQTKFTNIPSLNVKDIQVGEDFVIYILKDNRQYFIGKNNTNQQGLGQGNNQDIYDLTLISNKQWKQVSQGQRHVLQIDMENNLYQWGDNSNNQCGLGQGQPTIVTEPTLVDDGRKYVLQRQGYMHSQQLSENGQLYTVGNNSEGQLQVGDRTSRNVFTLVNNYTQPFQDVQLGYENTFQLYFDGRLLVQGRNSETQCGREYGFYYTRMTSFYELFSDYTPFNQIQYGYDSGLQINNNNELYAFGRNTFGETGQGNTSQRHENITPRVVRSNVDYVSLNHYTSLLLETNRDLYQQGRNDDYQFGNDTNTNSSTFVFVKSL